MVPSPEINIPMDAPVANAITAVGAPVQQFSFSHVWNVRMGRAAVSPRFIRARDLCLHDKTMSCKLISANFQGGSDSDDASATLSVLLPHTAIDRYERALLAPLRGEKAGDAKIVARSSQAVSVETAASDTARTVARLTAYRDRLADVAKRQDLGVDDIIKLEAERSRVQTELDQASNQERDLTDSIARESVTVQFTQRYEPVAPVGAFTHFLRNAGDTLTDSTANALLFAIAALPWLPFVMILIWLVSRLWRWLLQRRTIRVAISRGLGADAKPAG
jgi:hypothetical protein